MFMLVFLFFFFFQAEDGIRDKLVTGVQTCALPISRRGPRASSASCGPRPERRRRGSGRPRRRRSCRSARRRCCPPPRARPRGKRSEERRVGKSVDLGGRRSNKKKKEREREWVTEEV